MLYFIGSCMLSSFCYAPHEPRRGTWSGGDRSGTMNQTAQASPTRRRHTTDLVARCLVSTALAVAAGCTAFEGRRELAVCKRNYDDTYEFIALSPSELGTLLGTLSVRGSWGETLEPRPLVFSYWLFQASPTEAVLCEVERGRASAYRSRCWPGGWSLERDSTEWKATRAVDTICAL
jgi:hypothetical protein